MDYGLLLHPGYNGEEIDFLTAGCHADGTFVDIGANTTIDRGTLDDTVIEEGVKLDNLIHIAHNCRIGAACSSWNIGGGCPAKGNE